MKFPRILFSLITLILTSATNGEFLLNPETKNNPFFRNDSYIYVENSIRHPKGKELNKKGKTKRKFRCLYS